MIVNGEGSYFIMRNEDEEKLKVTVLKDGDVVVIDPPERPYIFVNKPGEVMQFEKILREMGVVAFVDENLRTGDEIKEPVIKLELRAPNLVPYVRDFLKTKGFRTFEDNIIYIRRLFIDKKLQIQYNDFVFFDIETDSRYGFPKEYGKYPFLSISVYGSKKQWNEWFYVKDYRDEREMLIDFIKFMREKKAHLVVGWNVEFDYNHVLERLRYYNLYDEYRYWKLVSRLDLMEEYKHRNPGLGSYSLHNISIEEGFKIKEMKKLPHEMTRQELYEYNMYDSEILVDINSKYDLVETAIEIAHSMNLPMSAASSTIARLEAEMFRRLRELGYVGVKREGERKRYRGAIVLDGIPGAHDNVLVLDYRSLYPNTIVIKNIDIKGFNGEVFPYIVKRSLDTRLEHKMRWKKLKKEIEKLKEEYQKNPTPELAEKIKKLEHEAKIEKLKSDAWKILVNGFYGANGNPYYYFFDVDIASAITAGGREMLQKAKDYIEKNYKLNVIYGDSVSGDSEILVVWNGVMYPIRIDALFGGKPDDVLGEKEYKFLKGVFSPAVNPNNKKIVLDEIAYIMRHKVKKRMYRIYSENRYVDVTEDHSIMVQRGNMIVELSPKELETDIDFIGVSYPDFDRRIVSYQWERVVSVEDLGVVEDYVYDVGMKNVHTFFANGILVHNTDSIFVELGDKYGPLDKERMGEIAEFMAADINEYVKPWVMDVDKLIKRIIFLQDEKGNFVKKRYAYVDFDGNIKIKGLETVKGDWPKFTKWLQRKIIELILLENKSRSEIMKFIREEKKKMFNGEYDEWLILAKNITKSIAEYDHSRKLPEHVRAWMKANEMGRPFELRQVTYVFTKDGPMPVWQLSDVKKYKLDYEYYWKNRVEKPIMKVVNSVFPVNRSILDWIS